MKNNNVVMARAGQGALRRCAARLGSPLPMPPAPWHSEGMLQRLLSLLPAVLLAVALAATGVTSAGMMAPDADAVAFAQFEHAQHWPRSLCERRL